MSLTFYSAGTLGWERELTLREFTEKKSKTYKKFNSAMGW